MLGNGCLLSRLVKGVLVWPAVVVQVLMVWLVGRPQGIALTGGGAGIPCERGFATPL